MTTERRTLQLARAGGGASGLLNTYGHRIGDYHAWANWARKLLAERTTTPIDTGGARRGWRSLAELAAEQVEESRQERLLI